MRMKLRLLNSLVVLMVFTACSQAVCRHTALTCALIYGEKMGDSKIGIALETGKHAQAFINDGKIQWVESFGPYCYIGVQDKFQPDRFMTIREYFERLFGFWAK
jgi:hypothetical protein